jgi:hypothetical protein
VEEERRRGGEEEERRTVHKPLSFGLGTDLFGKKRSQNIS